MSTIMSEYPFERKEVEQDLTDKMKSLLPPEASAFFVGHKRYVFNSERMMRLLPNIYNMIVKPDDVFGMGMPRSGTTWSQELIWLLENDLDFEKAKNTPFLERFPLLEDSGSRGQSSPILSGLHTLIPKSMLSDLNIHECKKNPYSIITIPNSQYSAVPDKFSEKMSVSLDLDQILTLDSRRFIKTHLPISLLPPSLLDTAKAVYIARDQRDVIVSLYHIMSQLINPEVNLTLKTMWQFFIENLIPNLQYFAHVKEAWELRNHPNMLFLFYEDMSKDLPGTIRKVATFLGKRLTEEQVEQLKDYLTFGKMKANVDLTSDIHKIAGENYFIRKGVVGGWREEFDEEMIAQADAWIADNLRGTDLRLPQQQ